MLEQGIAISIETVFGYLEGHGRTIEGYALATCFDEVADSIIGSLIVIHYHTTGVYTRAYTVIEHKGQATVEQTLEMVEIDGVFGLRNNDAAYLILKE